MRIDGAASPRNLAVIGSDLPLRFLSASVLAAIAFLGAWLGGIPAAVVTAAATVIVHLEWTRITEGAYPRALPFVAATAIAVLTAGAGSILIGIALAGLVAVVAALSSGGVWRPAGVLYAAAFAIPLLALRQSPELGFVVILFLFLVVAMTDTGALLAGRLIGGPKLWPRVSPKKTWAGAIGGLVGAVATGIVVAALAGLPITPMLIVVTLLLGLACEAGDLFESSVKRRFGAKDSGNIIPGHGGLMDRVDGLVFAGVAAALIGLLHAGPDDLAGGLLSW